MRHRMASGTGLGNPEPPLMNNKWSSNEKINTFIKIMGDEAIELYFKDYNGFDFQIGEDSVTIGIEPAYKFEKLKILHFNKDKDECYYQKGISWGYYGSDIVCETRRYKQYNRKSPFKNFVDKWYPLYLEAIS